jgi:hypothetical protein
MWFDLLDGSTRSSASADTHSGKSEVLGAPKMLPKLKVLGRVLGGPKLKVLEVLKPLPKLKV